MAAAALVLHSGQKETRYPLLTSLFDDIIRKDTYDYVLYLSERSTVCWYFSYLFGLERTVDCHLRICQFLTSWFTLTHVSSDCLETFKGTNGRQKTYEIFHVYIIFYSGFMCQTTVIFEITKDGSLVLNTLASWNCFTCRNLFQNGTNDMSECLTFETAFCKKAQNFV